MMSSLQDDIEDSRTSGIGRKRDLEDLAHYRRAGSVSSNEDQPRKRAKMDSNIANDTPMDLGTSPPPWTTSPHQFELSQVKDSNSSQAPPSTSWNKGIQGGLRTSFGSKAQRKTLSQGVAPLQSAKDEQAHRDGGDIDMHHEEEVTHDIAEPTSDMTLEEIEDASEKRTEDRYPSSNSSSGEESDFDDVHEPALTGKRPPKPLNDLLDDPSQLSTASGSNVQDESSHQSYEHESSSRDPDTITQNRPQPLNTENLLTSDRVELVYPRDVTDVQHSEKVSKIGNKYFHLREMLSQGKPISIQKITFRNFKDHFLESDTTFPKNLKFKHVKRAFQSYLNLYYGHALHLHDIARVTLNNVTSQEWGKAKERLAKRTSLEQPSGRSQEILQTTVTPGTVNDNAKTIRSSVAQQSASSKLKDDAPPTFTAVNARNLSASTRPEVTIQDSQKPVPVVQTLGGSSMQHNLPLSHSRTAEQTAMDIETRELELALHEKYFPAVAGSPMQLRCLACADTGHGTIDCPALSCTLCGIDGNHSDFMCPQKQRCQKCRGRGHTTIDCPEKLRASNAEIGRCDICDSPDHLETVCHFLWRTFAPKPEEIRTVNNIPVHCYACGSEGHYGPECGLRRGTIRSGGLTWSKSNLHKYLDPKCNHRAISSGVDYSIHKASKVFSIKGKANGPITVDDSDDDAPFIRSKVNNPSTQPRNGNIRFEQSSRIAEFPGNGSNARPHNPRRQAAPDFGSHRRIPNESARYGRERSFSPPPNYENFQQDNNSYRPIPYRQNNQGPAAGMPHTQQRPVDFSFQASRNPIGYRPNRGGRAGPGAAHGPGHTGGGKTAATEPKKKKKKPKKAKAERGGKGAH